jgi:hypothetical protein
MLAALTKCVCDRLVGNPTEEECRRAPKTTGGHASALSQSHLEEIANALCGGRKDRARSFVRDVRKLRDLADFVTDQDLAAVIKWLAPLLDESRAKVPRAAPSHKYTCVSRLLFPGLGRRADKHMQRWIEHVLLLRQLAVTSHDGDMLAALAWVESPSSARDVPQFLGPHTPIMADAFRKSLPRPSRVAFSFHGAKSFSGVSASMPVEFGRPTMVTATATTATIRGKPSRPQRTLSRIPRWVGL